VLSNFNDHAVEITTVLFPGEYASLKEKPYYNEVLQSVLSASGGAKKPRASEESH
jgi:hypothetical protein